MIVFLSLTSNFAIGKKLTYGGNWSLTSLSASDVKAILFINATLQQFDVIDTFHMQMEHFQHESEIEPDMKEFKCYNRRRLKM